ncbi:MAG TPA: RDD family protein [Acidimicrobiales bacterium]|nr:RDD family protein [Acidimicrobiales bacterium]
MTTRPNNPWEGRNPDQGRPYPPPPAPAPSSPSSADWPPPGGDYPPPGGGYPPPGGGYPGGQWNQGYGAGESYGDLAGWWSRVGATIIDGIIIGIPAFLLFYAAGSGSVGARASAEIVVVIAEALYFTLMLSRQGRTVGNMAVGTRVIDARTGGPLSTGKALGRWAAQLLFGLLSVALFIPTLLDYLWPLWDRRNQTLHDKIAGTLVVYYR